jgi:hypothetical protein
MQTIVTAVRQGSPAGLTAALGGIRRSTYYDWVRRGTRALEAEEMGESIPRKERLFAEFALEVQKAQAEWEAGQLKAIAKADDWTAHAWLLERRFPDRYGRPGRRSSGRMQREDSALYLHTEP